MGEHQVLNITNAKISEFLEGIPDAALIVNRSGVILFANAHINNLFGYEKNSLIDQKAEVLLPEPYRSKNHQHRTNYFAILKNKPLSSGMKLFGQRKNGEIFPIEINLGVINNKEQNFALVIIRDMTERALLDQALHEKYVEIENANTAREKFISSMNHELRNPLNAILGFTGTLLMKLPGPLNDDQETQLKIIKNSVKELLDMLTSITTLAKIESGKLEVAFQEVNCLNAANEVSSALSPLAQAKGLKIHIDPHRDIVIHTDHAALTQILTHLIHNAIKFTEKGEIRIRFERQVVDDKKFLAIHVHDTGKGIRHEDHDKLFQAFQKLTASDVHGAGLGLHASQRLAKLINGKIEFASEFGKGSRFTILLPDN